MIQREISTSSTRQFLSASFAMPQEVPLDGGFMLLSSFSSHSNNKNNECVSVSFFGSAGFCGGICLARFFKK